MTDPTLAALAEAIASRKKSVAEDCWPNVSARTAHAKLDRVLSGELGIPARLLRLALEGTGAGALLDHFHALTARDPNELRLQVIRGQAEVRAQLELFTAQLKLADDLEREQLGVQRGAGMARASAERERARGRR